MNSELLERAASLLKRDDQILHFRSKFKQSPIPQIKALSGDMETLLGDIPGETQVQTPEDLYNAELRRLMSSRLIRNDVLLSGRVPTLGDIFVEYCLNPEDITLERFRSLLEETKDDAEAATGRLFEATKDNEPEFYPAMDIPKRRQETEAFAREKILSYHEELALLYDRLSGLGNQWQSIYPEPTTRDDSYFSFFSRTLGLAIKKVCYESRNGTTELNVNTYELLRLFGHEGFGHGVQRVLTAESDLPFFLTDFNTASEAAVESIAQHFEVTIFEDINSSPEAQQALGIADTFGDVYQLQQDRRMLELYTDRLTYYSILLMADRTMGNPLDASVLQKKMDIFGEVALEPNDVIHFIGNNASNYYPGGFYRSSLLRNLRYASDAAAQAIAVFDDNGFPYAENRKLIDTSLLTGYFTPVGVVKKAELAAATHAPQSLTTEGELTDQSLI